MFKRFVVLFLLFTASGLYSVNAQEVKGFQGHVETETALLVGGGFNLGVSFTGGYRYNANFWGLGIGYDLWGGVPAFFNY